MGERTEASVGVLSLDPLSPVLGEEHVGRESTLGGVLVLFALLCALVGLVGSLALLKG